MSIESERMQILEMIESGKITPVEGIQLLKALEEGSNALPEEITADIQEDETAGLPPEQPLSPPAGGAVAYESPEEDAAPPLPPQPFAGVPPEAPPPSAEGMGGDSVPRDLVNLEAGAAREEEERSHEAAQGEILPTPSIGPDINRWKKLWQIPLWIGVVVTVLSGLLMFQAFQAGGFGFWFACTWFPFLLGVAVIALAWSTRNLPWLHIRVQQKPGEKPQRIAISFPLPLGLIRLGLRIFKGRIPNMGNVDLDEIVQAMEHITPDAPFSVDVNEGDDGEKVQIFIG